MVPAVLVVNLVCRDLRVHPVHQVLLVLLVHLPMLCSLLVEARDLVMALSMMKVHELIVGTVK